MLEEQLGPIEHKGAALLQALLQLWSNFPLAPLRVQPLQDRERRVDGENRLQTLLEPERSIRRILGVGVKACR